ncbi:MAG: ABC transporter permease [Acutalibacteraceae bacterium]
MRISDIFLAFPEMVCAIAIAGVLNGGIWSAAIAVGLIAWPRYARVARSQVLAMKNHQYMNAAKLMGTRWYKVILKHIMPNILGSIVVTAALDVGMIMNLAVCLTWFRCGSANRVGFYDERRTQHASTISMDCIGARSCYFYHSYYF